MGAERFFKFIERIKGNWVSRELGGFHKRVKGKKGERLRLWLYHMIVHNAFDTLAERNAAKVYQQSQRLV